MGKLFKLLTAQWELLFFVKTKTWKRESNAGKLLVSFYRGPRDWELDSRISGLAYVVPNTGQLFFSYKILFFLICVIFYQKFFRISGFKNPFIIYFIKKFLKNNSIQWKIEIYFQAPFPRSDSTLCYSATSQSTKTRKRDEEGSSAELLRPFEFR